MPSIVAISMKRLIRYPGSAILRFRVERVLHQQSPPSTARTDAMFDVLQETIPTRDLSIYAYDDYSIWQRANDRCTRLLGRDGMAERGKRILEVGCGDGMVGALLSTFGHQVTLTDMEDWRHESARRLPLVRGMLEQSLPLEAQTFDFVFSYNTFEHLQDPGASLRELMRLTRPGGQIFLEFGPLYNSAWGLHAYRTINVPFPQFLFSPEVIHAKLRELGIRDLGVEREDPQPLNRWSLQQFNRLWQDSGCEIVDLQYISQSSETKWILRFPECFRGRRLAWRDVTTSGIRVLLRVAEQS